MLPWTQEPGKLKSLKTGHFESDELNFRGFSPSLERGVWCRSRQYLRSQPGQYCKAIAGRQNTGGDMRTENSYWDADREETMQNTGSDM
ncbi:hypothetical protein RRG08_026705 [Elysia crispata]|uniref:Uncharacterized protein n=1 Tax=Elysia crispata TaxID=231223 RepID=A0AAE0XVS4_9GAST|nr:hypothetical protein RRG08_026705 [Elysia crispata]